MLTTRLSRFSPCQAHTAFLPDYNSLYDLLPPSLLSTFHHLRTSRLTPILNCHYDNESLTIMAVQQGELAGAWSFPTLLPDIGGVVVLFPKPWHTFGSIWSLARHEQLGADLERKFQAPDQFSAQDFDRVVLRVVEAPAPTSRLSELLRRDIIKYLPAFDPIRADRVLTDLVERALRRYIRKHSLSSKLHM